jgi:hypothetical protein
MEHLMPGLAKYPLRGKKFADIGFDVPTNVNDMKLC